MTRNLIISFVIITALISACVYTNSGTYYVDPVPGEPPTISVSSNLDTMYDPRVIDSLEIIYEVEIVNGEFYLVDAVVNDTSVYSSDTINGSFWIQSSLVEEPGVDTIFMRIYYSTNSNSLADVVGLEANILDLEYPVTFEGGVK